MQPTMPAITNDLTTDRLRGRTNALGSIAFQVPSVIAPGLAGWLIARDLAAVYVGGLVVGCVLVVVIAVGWLEPRLDAVANGTARASSPPVPPPVDLVDGTPARTTPARPDPWPGEGGSAREP